MCLTKDLLVRFYSEMDMSFRVLIHYRVLSEIGRPFDQFIMEEPWRVWEILEKTLGRHNAQLLLGMLAAWLSRNGCRVTVDELRRILSDRSAWR